MRLAVFQQPEKNESGQLHTDRSQRNAAEGARRERTPIEPDQLLRVAAQGPRGRRSLAQRVTAGRGGTSLGPLRPILTVFKL